MILVIRISINPGKCAFNEIGYSFLITHSIVDSYKVVSDTICKAKPSPRGHQQEQ